MAHQSRQSQLCALLREAYAIVAHIYYRVSAVVLRALDWGGEVSGWLLSGTMWQLIAHRRAACFGNVWLMVLVQATVFLWFRTWRGTIISTRSVIERTSSDIHMNFIIYLFIGREWFLIVLCVDSDCIRLKSCQDCHTGVFYFILRSSCWKIQIKLFLGIL